MYGLLFLALGYLLGSIPVAYLVARSRGADVFQTGTSNPGAANVFRTIGRGAGVLVLLGDVAKGAIPVLLARWAGVSPWIALAAGVAALVGHWYPIFLRFRGGAGLATAIGVAYAIMPLPSLLGTLPALVLLYFWRSVGPVAAIGFLLLFVAALLLGEPVPLALAIVTLPPLALARQRLLPTPGVERAARDGPTGEA